MTWRVPPYDRAVDEAVAYIQATWSNLHGIVIAGSIVRGEGGPTSDLDIFIVHAETWRLREQKRFAGVPAELFVNPPDRVRGYFASEHADGRPCTAHMLATGLAIANDAVLDELIREARDWLAKPLAPTPTELASKRYGAVDALDDARDVVTDPVACALLLGNAVEQIVAYAFWQRAMFQPRRKDRPRALAAIDPVAAELLRAFVEARGDQALPCALALANHVLGVDTFFEWASDRS